MNKKTLRMLAGLLIVALAFGIAYAKSPATSTGVNDYEVEGGYIVELFNEEAIAESDSATSNILDATVFNPIYDAAVMVATLSDTAAPIVTVVLQGAHIPYVKGWGSVEANVQWFTLHTIADSASADTTTMWNDVTDLTAGMTVNAIVDTLQFSDPKYQWAAYRLKAWTHADSPADTEVEAWVRLRYE